MATIMSWEKENQENFEILRSAEILSSLRPLILGGLNSTQIRVRQSTYRFLLSSTLMAGVKFLPEIQGVELLKVMDHIGNEFEADAEDWFGRPVPQLHDYAAIIFDRFVEDGYCHPETLRPIVKSDNDSVEWVWHHYDGKDYPLGTVDVYRESDKMKLEIFMRSKVVHLREMLMIDVPRGRTVI
jgi:hypothetical protein